MVALRQYISGATHRFILRPGGALHMYEAHRWLVLNFWRALLQVNFLSIVTSCEKT